MHPLDGYSGQLSLHRNCGLSLSAQPLAIELAARNALDLTGGEVLACLSDLFTLACGVTPCNPGALVRLDGGGCSMLRSLLLAKLLLEGSRATTLTDPSPASLDADDGLFLSGPFQRTPGQIAAVVGLNLHGHLYLNLVQQQPLLANGKPAPALLDGAGSVVRTESAPGNVTSPQGLNPARGVLQLKLLATPKSSP